MTCNRAIVPKKRFTYIIILMVNGYWNKKILQQVPTHTKETLWVVLFNHIFVVFLLRQLLDTCNGWRNGITSRLISVGWFHHVTGLITLDAQFPFLICCAIFFCQIVYFATVQAPTVLFHTIKGWCWLVHHHRMKSTYSFCNICYRRPNCGNQAVYWMTSSLVTRKKYRSRIK